MRLFIYCADPRPEASLGRKINEVLIAQGEQVMRLCCFGGPIALAHPKEMAQTFAYMTDQIRFAVKCFSPEEIVIVGHDCGFYNHFVALKGTSVAQKRKDIIVVMELLKKRYARNDVTVRAFFDVSSEDCIKFEPLHQNTAKLAV